MQKVSLPVAFLFVVLGAGLANAQNKAEAIKKDLKAFEAKWKTDKMETGGDTSGNADRMGVLFDGDEYTFTFDGKPKATAKIRLDPTTTPKSIDIQWTSGAASGNTSLAIYRIT